MKAIRIVVAAMVLLGTSTHRRAAAYTIGTGFTEGCHEGITAAGFGEIVAMLAAANVPLPSDIEDDDDDDGDEWMRVGGYLVTSAGLDVNDFSVQEYFVLHSLLVGVRSPDTAGHSVLNLDRARSLHTDPAPVGQYAHSLRASTDDFAMGDRVAVGGMRAAIAAEIDAFRQRLGDAPQDQFETVEVYFDFYGTVDVQVWGPAYHVGRAAHALQDSFSHSIRDEGDGFRSLITVLNFADAVTGTLVESQDGIAHSVVLDSCGEETASVVAAATAATAALFAAAGAIGSGTDDGALSPVLEEWFQLREGCDASNDWCGNVHWVELARSQPTTPFLCAVGWGGEMPAWPHVWLRLLVALLILRRLGWRRRRTRGAGVKRRWWRVGAAAVLIGAMGLTASVDAQEPGSQGPGAPARIVQASGADSMEEIADENEGALADVTRSPRELAETLREALADVSRRRRGLAVAIELGGSLLTPLVDFSTRSLTVNYAVRTSYHLPDFAFTVMVEHGLWRAPELGGQAWQHAFNLGIGIERFHHSGFLRTMILVGPSVLLRSNDLDDKGSIGLFVDLRPLGFNWRVSERWAVVADLLHMTLVAPVLTGVPLIDFQFRTTLGMEAKF